MRFFRIILISFLALSYQGLLSQDLELKWLHNFGSKQEDGGNFVKTDFDGNVYFLGNFYDTIDFDPSAGKTEFISQGFSDMVFAKYTNQGALIWARAIGGPLLEKAYSFDLDRNGNFYIAGSFVQTVDMDPGPGVQNFTSKGGPDVFISKFNPDGLWMWTKIITGIGNTYMQDIKVDPQGNVFVTGHFTDKVDLDPSADSLILIAKNNNKSDVFLLKLTTHGDFIWGFNSGGKLNEYANALAVNQYGDVALAVSFEDTVDFDPSPTNTAIKISNLYRNAVLVKYSTLGEFLWAHHFYGTCINGISSITLDSNDNYYLTGFIEGGTDFNPTEAYTVLTSSGLSDIFMAKYSTAGSLIWAKSMGGTSYDVGSSIKLDKMQNIYLGGSFNNTVDFDPSAGIRNHTSAGGSDIFLCKYTNDGQVLKTYRMGGSSDDGMSGLEIRKNLDIFIAGSFNSTVDFDPGTPVANRTSVGWVDMYLGKYSQCKPIVTNIQVTKCNSYTSPSNRNIWTESGNYTDTLTSAIGCDSIINITLVITKSKATNSYIKACKGYKWIDGKQYFNSTDTPKYYIPLGSGCDSIVNLNLTIENIDTILWLKSDSLYSKQDSAIYQWEDCQKGPIPGANMRSFRPQNSGSYRLILTRNGCSSASSCMKYELLNINKNEIEEPLLFPIPCINGRLTLQLPNLNKLALIRIYRPDGKLEKTISRFNTNQYELQLSNVTGVFILEFVYDDAKILFQRIVNISENK